MVGVSSPDVCSRTHVSCWLRFCVVTKKEKYPEQQPAKRVSGSTQQIYRQPGHTVYLLPTMVLANLLPCDLNYYIKGTSIKGLLKPGKEAVLHAVDTSQNTELGRDFSSLLVLVVTAASGVHSLVFQEFCWRTLPCARSC